MITTQTTDAAIRRANYLILGCTGIILMFCTFARIADVVWIDGYLSGHLAANNWKAARQ